MKIAIINKYNRVMEMRVVQSAVASASTIILEDNEECGIGLLYVPNETPRFQAVAQVFPAIAPRWTAFQFLLRFTEQERETFRVAALTDGKIADFMQLCGAASEVEANHPLTVAGMEYLVSQDLLTQARADEVLGN
jgi:hypothetical protein